MSGLRGATARALALLGAMLCTALCAPAAAGPLDEARLAAAFDRVDRNRDDRLSLAEARRFGIRRGVFDHAASPRTHLLDRAQFAAALQRQFELADRRRNGVLDFDEAKAAGVRSKRLFRAADANDDARLDFGEYLDAMQRGLR